MQEALDYMSRMYWNFGENGMRIGWDIVALIVGLLMFEWGNRTKEHPLQFEKLGKIGRFGVYFVLIY